MTKVTQTKEQKQLIRDLIKIVSNTKPTQVSVEMDGECKEFWLLRFPHDGSFEFRISPTFKVKMIKNFHIFEVESKKLYFELAKSFHERSAIQERMNIDERCLVMKDISEIAKSIKPAKTSKKQK